MMITYAARNFQKLSAAWCNSNTTYFVNNYKTVIIPYYFPSAQAPKAARAQEYCHTLPRNVALKISLCNEYCACVRSNNRYWSSRVCKNKYMLGTAERNCGTRYIGSNTTQPSLSRICYWNCSLKSSSWDKNCDVTKKSIKLLRHSYRCL